MPSPDDPLRESGDPACEPEHQNSNGNVGSNGDIDVTSAIPIMGTASAGPGSTVNLGSGASAEEILEDQPYVPADPDPVPACNTTAEAGGAYSDGTGITLTDGKFFGPVGCVAAGTGCTDETGDLNKLGDLVGAADDIVLAPPASAPFVDADGYAVYCFADVKLGSAALVISGPTKIYVTNMFVSGSGSFSNTTLIPNNLHLYSSFGGDSGYAKDGMTINGGATAFAVIHAPTTDVILGGGGDIFGSVLGWSVELTGGSAVHYDEALGGASGSGAAGLLFAHWREVRSF